jgi:SET domain-containing protein
MPLTPSDAIEVKRVRGKGRGVFARRPIEEGEVIETCPVLVLPAESIEDDLAGIACYVFEWGRGKVALALGFGSLYNHSYRPNARYADVAGRTKLFTAIRDIAAGEEITVNYNGEPGDETPVGFEVVEGAGSAGLIPAVAAVGRSARDRRVRSGPRPGGPHPTRAPRGSGRPRR